MDTDAPHGATSAPGALGPLDVQDVVALPLPATVVPTSFSFARGDSCITFLHDDSGSAVRCARERRSTARQNRFALEVCLQPSSSLQHRYRRASCSGRLPSSGREAHAPSPAWIGHVHLHRIQVKPITLVDDDQLSREEKLRRERLRERGQGVTSYRHV